MRLPFGFGRRSGSGSGASGGGPGIDAGAGAASAATARPPSRAWADLPPIQRTAGAMPLVAAPGRFAGELPGTQELPPIVQPLGHEVSALATPGLVVAHARAVPSSPGGALPVPVQRRASRAGRQSAAVQREVAADDPAAPEVPGVTDAAALEPPGDAPVVQTVRSLPTVSRLTIRMPDRPLTSAAIAARSPVQRSAVGSRARSEASVDAPVTGSGMRRVPSTASKPVVSRSSTSAQAPTASPAPRADDAPARRGLGEPLAIVPASARPVGAAPVEAPASLPISRAIAGVSVTPPRAAGRSSLQRSASNASDAEPDTASPDAMPVPLAAATVTQAGAALPELPVISVSRSRAGRAAATLASPASPESAGPAIRPLVGAAPLRPTIRVQRSEAADDEPADDGASLPSPWWAPPAPSQPSAARSERGEVPPTISRIHEEAGTEPPVEPADLVHSRAGHGHGPASPAAVQRSSMSGPLPRARSAIAVQDRGRAAETAAPWARPVEPATSPQGSVVAAAAPAPVVQTSPATITFPPPATAATPAAPVVQRAESSRSSAPPTAAAGRSESDLEELAQALFSRIRGRLRSELIHDREAKGLGFDNV